MTICPDNPMAFLQQVTSDPRSKEKVTMEELVRIVNQIGEIKGIRDKGLMAVLLSQLINVQFSLFFIRLKTVHGNICRISRPERKKR